MVEPWVERRLREEKILWLTTVRADGQPQPVPVWYLWGTEGFLIYSRPNAQKLRNIRSNPRVGLNLNCDERGGSVVRAEGTAEIVEDAAPASEIPEYVQKYREDMRRLGYEPAGFALDYAVAVRVTPRRWQSW